MKIIPTIIGLAIFLSVGTASAQGVEKSSWSPETGDRIVVDTGKSILYIVHTDGTFLTIDGLTGQRRTVSYDGLTYFAATPERSWEIRPAALEKKGRSVTFGEGRFLRLSWPGHQDFRRRGIGDGESTAYGIHSHLSFAKMMEDKTNRTGYDTTGNGWRSMGCILVSEEDLDLIVQTWRNNGEFLSVVTQNGVDPLAFAPTTTSIAKIPSWLGFLQGAY